MISKEEVKKITDLSRLAISDEELIGLQADLENILVYVSAIQKASVSPVERKSRTPWLYKVKNVVREDKNPHQGGIYSDKLLKEVPRAERAYVKVKKILP